MAEARGVRGRRGEKRATAVADEHERMQFHRLDEGSDADLALLARVHETAVAALTTPTH